jgi:hypothetical protein
MMVWQKSLLKKKPGVENHIDKVEYDVLGYFRG